MAGFEIVETHQPTPEEKLKEQQEKLLKWSDKYKERKSVPVVNRYYDTSETTPGKQDTMELKCIVTTWGGILVHESSCEYVAFDWRHHGQTEWTLDAVNRADAAKQMLTVVHTHDRFPTMQSRMLYHWCAEKFK